MSKNFASVYASGNYSSALEQSFYLKLESVRGTLALPVAADYMYTTGGSSIEHTQPIESSPHKTGRHHNDIIKSKKEMNFTINALFNIDESLGAASSAEVDAPVRLLYKSTLGSEVLTSGAVYSALTEPSLTFSIYEVGDRWSKQARGCFVNNATFTFPGDGMATASWTGMGGEALLVGVGKSVTANITNTVTLAAGEGDLFPVGAKVMIIKSDGVTRSTDTAAGTARTVLSVAGDVVTLSGAALTDADGSSTPVYLAYYEPPTKTAISNPVTGLVGSVVIAGLSEQCIRNATITVANDHEPVNFCFGSDALDGAYFTAASRMTATLSLEMNLNQATAEFFNRVQQFEAQDVTLVLGDAAGRHFEALMPRVIFPVPAISVPDAGSIPITFEGTCYQSALDAADEITLSFI